MLEVDPFGGVDFHRLGMVAEVPEPVDFLSDVALPDLGPHDHGLALVYVGLQVADGLVAAVGDEDKVLEPGVSEVREDRLQTPGVGDVPREGAVIDGHVAA